MTDAPRQHHRVVEIAVSDVVADDFIIPIDEKRVDALAESIKQIGLLQPVAVVGRRLIAGRHRLEAIRKLGWPTIPAVELQGLDALDVELASVDENLNRHQLSAAVYAILLVRRKRLYIQRHPDTAVRAAQRAALERRRGVRNDEKVEDFATNLARASSLSVCHTRNLIRAGEYLGEERLRRLIGTSMDSQVQLLCLCRLPVESRDGLIESAAAGEGVSARIIWRGVKKTRGKLPLRSRPSPPLVEAPTAEPAPAPLGANPIVQAWRRASSFERRQFVSRHGAELTAILKALDVSQRAPAPVFSLHA